MHELTALLERATERIATEYFQVSIDGGDPIYRERVYCYELYHQLRCLWPATSEFYLSGELDKAAHPILRELGADYAKPDLLVHCPGYMSGNYAIIEIKPSNAIREGIKDDSNKLPLFLNKVGYKRAIYLIFSREVQATAKRVQDVAKAIANLPSIELWLHSEPGHSATYGPLTI